MHSDTMASSSTNVLPTGCQTLTAFPDRLFLPEIVFGGLVWCLVASTYVSPANPMGWVMFVSVFCFAMTTLWFFIFLRGGNQSGNWPALDAGYHFVAVVLYMSSSVMLAFIATMYSALRNSYNQEVTVTYRTTTAAVVMSFITTLLYFLHAVFSAIRWKRS